MILFAIATGLGIWIYLGQSSQSLNPDNQNNKTLTRFQAENVKEIHIQSDGIKTVISKHNELWFFDQPVADRADQATIKAVLDLLTHLTLRDQLSADEIKNDEKLSDQELGFNEEDQIEVALVLGGDSKKSKTNDTLTLVFGKPAPMTNTIYARIKGKDKQSSDVYVVDGNPRQYFEDPAAALRDQTLLFAPVSSLTGLSIRTAGNSVKLAKKTSPTGTEWLMTHPLPARANAELIENILAQLSSLRVETLLDSKESNAANPNPVPENAVVFELQIKGLDKAISVFLSPAKTPGNPAAEPVASKAKELPLLEARVSDRPATFLIRSPLLQQLPDNSNTYRDPYLARIPLPLLHSIIIQTRSNPNVILTAMPPAEGQIKWKSDRNSKRENANLGKIVRLVNSVNEEKIISFIAPDKAKPADYGLDHPFTAITFNVFKTIDPNSSNDTNQNLAQANAAQQKPELIQHTLKLGRSKNDANRLFASFIGEPYIYEISPAFQNRVSPHPLKWKAPKVISFSILTLREIERSKADQKALQLKYDYTRDQWSGKQDGSDISKEIDRRVALKLASTLGSLTSQDWITTSQLAYKALEQPKLTIKILIEEIDRALQTPTEVTHTLRFSAAATSGFYYGSLDNSPDVFIIDRATFRDLSQPIITTPAALRPAQN